MAIGLGLPVLYSSAAEAAKSGTAETPSSTTAVTPKSGIDSAKREFEAMKASRDPAHRDQRTALPGISVPQLHVEERGPAPAILPGKNAKQDPAAKKSSNWLVEAMDKEAARNGKNERGERERIFSRRSDEEEREGGAVSRSDPALERARGDSAAEERKYDDETTNRKRAAEAANPLTRYLEGWITPKDYAVLRPSLEESLGGRELAQSAAGPATPGGIAGTVGIGGVGSAMMGDATKTPVSPVPRENPYLEAMQTRPEFGASAPTFAVAPPNVAPPPAPPASIAAPAPPIVPSARSKIPEFAKPQQDERYFKQLKRF